MPSLSLKHAVMGSLIATCACSLWAHAKDAAVSFAYLRFNPFTTQSAFAEILDDLSTRDHQPFWAAIGADGNAMLLGSRF